MRHFEHDTELIEALENLSAIAESMNSENATKEMMKSAFIITRLITAQVASDLITILEIGGKEG